MQTFIEELGEDPVAPPRGRVRTTARLFQVLGVTDAAPRERRETVSLWLLHQAAASTTAREPDDGGTAVVDEVLVGGLLRRQRRVGDVVGGGPLGLAGGPGRTRLLRRWDQGVIEVDEQALKVVLTRRGGSHMAVTLRAEGPDLRRSGSSRRRPSRPRTLASWASSGDLAEVLDPPGSDVVDLRPFDT